ncbi:MAG: hypothetical protein Q8M56_12425 [Desulfobacterales bacterium]|nr:hypothetical protein [Desulfobacterales bacterium]
MKARKVMFAGSWYPESAPECEREIKDVVSTAIHGSADNVNAKAHGEACVRTDPVQRFVVQGFHFS